MGYLTWGDIKKKVEESGCTDDTEIFYIDIYRPYEGVDASVSDEGLIVTD